jgi:hypothetical protein
VSATTDERTDMTETTAQTTVPTIDPDAVAADYLAAWNATDPAERRTLLEQRWSPEAVYVDPLAVVAGHDGVDAVIAAVQRQFPDMPLRLVGRPDGHHRQVRFQWGLGPAGTEPIVVGFDVVTLDDDGRVRDVRGFLDVVPG